MRKLFRIALGFLLILVGFILSLPFVPGPGFAIIILGLVVLSEYFPWAKRIVDWGKRKLEGTKKKGKPGNQPESSPADSG